MEPKKDKKYRRVMVLGILMMGVAGVILAALLLTYWNSARTAERYSEKYAAVNTVQETVPVTETAEEQKTAETGTEEKVGTEATEAETEEEIPWYGQITVDLEAAMEENPEVVGWIYLENEDLSYPILYSGDNETYLKTGIDGGYSVSGCIFLDGRNSTDFKDRRTVIYGHNMRNLTMFGKLKYYNTDEDYYEEHKYFQIFTRDRVYRYQIFAYSVEKPSEEINRVEFETDEEFLDYVGELNRRSYLKTDLDVTAEDHIVTLYTCSGDNKLLVHGVRVAKHKRNSKG